MIFLFYFCVIKQKIESKKEITTEEGEKFAKEHGYMFHECSVKDDSKNKLMSIFNKLAKEVYENSPEKRKEKEIMKKILEEEEIKKMKETEEENLQKDLISLSKFISI